MIPNFRQLSLSLLAVTQFFCIGFAQTHSVVSGDTLFELANRYATTVDELIRINSLSSQTIQVGQVLNVAAPAASGGAASEGVISHTVVEGETLANIAPRYGKTEAELRRANPAYADALGDAPLAVGLIIYIAPADGEVVILRPGESILSLALKYGFTPSELATINGVASASALRAGQPVFIPAGAEPFAASTPVSATAATESTIEAADSTASVTEAQSSALPAREQHLALQRRVIDNAPTLLASYKPAPINETFNWPVSGRITSGYGRRNIAVGGNTFHGGLDIGASSGTPVAASRGGVISRAGWGGAYGYVIYINHPDGSQTRYAHLSKLDVAKGTSVRQGQTIGSVGSTGASTGAHLHFEIRFEGRSVDPLGYLQAR